jgi:diacylglycerol O-acyltransferase / wax synthase
MQQLSALDTAFLALETSRSPMHVGTLAIYSTPAGSDQPLTREAVVARIAGRLHRSTTFRQRVLPVPFGLDRPYWVDDARFDLDAHVRHHTLPPPGDRRTLWAEAARILARPLDLSRPPWEIWVVDGLDPSAGGTAAVFAKVHHAAVDGLSGMEILAAIHDRHARPPADDPPPDSPPPGEPSDLALLARAGAHMLTAPMRFNRMVREDLPALTASEAGPAATQRRPRLGAPRTRFNGLVSAERVVDGCSFTVADLRLLQSRVEGAMANDVILAIVGGALRRQLLSAGELPDRSLVAMVPLSLRSRSQRDGGNRVSAMLVPLGTDITDPVERLEAVVRRTRRSKRRGRGGAARRLIEYLDVVPLNPATLAVAPTWVAAGGVDPMVNCVVTNVPLGRRPIFLAGARLEEVYGNAPILDGVGLMHVVLTYDGKTTIGVTSCPTMLADAHAYTEHLRRSFGELQVAVG